MAGEPSRRQLLALAGAAGLGSMLPRPAAAAGPGWSPDVGRKFAADGTVLPFAGNTIVCHLPQQGPDSAAFHAALDIYRELPTRRFTRKLAVLPPSSYHMTLFGIATDANRSAAAWPEGVARDVSIAECTRIVGERLRAARFADLAPIRMRIDTGEGGADPWTLRLHLLPIDAAEAQRLRDLRDRIADAVRLRAPDHDRYVFHVTLGYWLRTLDASETADYARAIGRWRAAAARAAPVVTLGPPEYCFFRDMFAFDRRACLAG